MTHQQNEDLIGISPAIELKFVATASVGELSGHAAVFGNRDSHGDTIRKGAFAASLAAHQTAGTLPALLWSHDMARPVGRVLHLAESDHGLNMRAKLNLATTAGRDAYEHVKAGDATGLSIGYLVPPGGATHGKDGRTLQRVALNEISLVTMPSNERARVHEVKALANAADLERLLRDAGLSSRAAERIAAGGYPALTKSTEPEPSIDIDRIKAVLRQHDVERKAAPKSRFYRNH